MTQSEPRILITRLSAIGDCIATMPMLCAVRDVFPQAFIAWIVEPGAATLLQGHSCLDEVIVVPKRWLQSPRAAWSLRSRLRAMEFDVTIDPQSLTKSAAAAWLTGASRRIGFATPRGRELSRWLNNELVAPRASHIVDAQMELLEPLGVRRPAVRFAVPLDPAAERTVDALLGAQHLRLPFATINVGAGWNSRLWPQVRFGRVARYLGVKRGMPSLVVWNGEREREWAEQVVAASGGHAILAPPTSLSELGVLLRRARLYIGSDTGPMHLAAAVGTPCVALFGPTRPQDSGPYGSYHECVQHRFAHGTGRQRRRMGNDAMLEITVEAVCEACDRLVDRTQTIYRPPRTA